MLLQPLGHLSVIVRAAIAFVRLPAQSHTIKPFGARYDYLETQKATANTQREQLRTLGLRKVLKPLKQ